MSDEKTAKEEEKKTVDNTNNTSKEEVTTSDENNEVLENALVDESTKTKAPTEKVTASFQKKS